MSVNGVGALIPPPPVPRWPRSAVEEHQFRAELQRRALLYRAERRQAALLRFGGALLLILAGLALGYWWP